MAGDGPLSDPESDLPEWARWLRRQLNGVNLVIGGIALVAIAALTLWGKFPDWPDDLDCSDYSMLTVVEIEECQAR